jgi:hypothetical protein
MMKTKYEIILFRSEEDQAYLAEVPELPGCMADGATQQKALANAEKSSPSGSKPPKKSGGPFLSLADVWLMPKLLTTHLRSAAKLPVCVSAQAGNQNLNAKSQSAQRPAKLCEPSSPRRLCVEKNCSKNKKTAAIMIKVAKSINKP